MNSHNAARRVIERKGICGTLVASDTSRFENNNRSRWLVVIQTLGDKTLNDRLEECKNEGVPGIPGRELIVYMREAARAIDYLNVCDKKDSYCRERPAIQHCDIKPTNILLTGNSIQLCDYGLSHVIAADKFFSNRY